MGIARGRGRSLAGTRTHWEPSLAFRRFRRQHTELSRVYWTLQLGVDSLDYGAATAAPGAAAVATLHGTFGNGMLPMSIAELRAWLSPVMGRSRLHLLVVCAASLEAYLKDITFLHIGAMGHLATGLKLDDVGRALGAPILERDSLPEPLKYAEVLFGVSYGPHRAILHRAYKLRCALAHAGGVVTARTKRDIPELKAGIGTVLELSWPELREALAAADQIATVTDMATSTYRLRLIEAERELDELAKGGKLPPRLKLWSELHAKLSIHGLRRADKQALEDRYYSRHPASRAARR